MALMGHHTNQSLQYSFPVFPCPRTHHLFSGPNKLRQIRYVLKRLTHNNPLADIQISSVSAHKYPDLSIGDTAIFISFLWRLNTS